MCTICQEKHCLELLCGCANQCQFCILRIIRFSVRSKELWGGLISACLVKGHSISVSEALEIANGSELEAEIYNNLCVLQAIKRLPGISICPDQCGYAGWVNASKKCYSPVECEKCGAKWVDSQLLPLWYRSYRLCHYMYTGQLCIEVHREAWAVPCPLCQVDTQGQVVSINTTCPRCRFLYCNQCGEYAISNHTACYIRNLFKLFICLFGVLLSAFKVLGVWRQLETSSSTGFSVYLNLVCLLFAFGLVWLFLFVRWLHRHEPRALVFAAVTMGVYAGQLVASEYLLGVRGTLKGAVALGTAVTHCSLAFCYFRQ